MGNKAPGGASASGGDTPRSPVSRKVQAKARDLAKTYNPANSPGPDPLDCVYGFTVRDSSVPPKPVVIGSEHDPRGARYCGKVLLIVNIASK